MNLSEVKKPRVFYLGISEGTKPHVSNHRVWSTDYELIEKVHFDKAIEALKDSAAMIGVATTLLEFHGKTSKELKNCVANLVNAEARAEKILKELGCE